MEVLHSSLVILGANTETPQVLWNGISVPTVGGSIYWDGIKHNITLNIKEDSQLAEMKAAGINVKRV